MGLGSIPALGRESVQLRVPVPPPAGSHLDQKPSDSLLALVRLHCSDMHYHRFRVSSTANLLVLLVPLDELPWSCLFVHSPPSVALDDDLVVPTPEALSMISFLDGLFQSLWFAC